MHDDTTDSISFWCCIIINILFQKGDSDMLIKSDM